jgi:hypothetical protein
VKQGCNGLNEFVSWGLIHVVILSLGCLPQKEEPAGRVAQAFELGGASFGVWFYKGCGL